MPPIDGAALRQLQEDLGGEPAVMRDLIDTFLKEGPRLVAGMREGVEKGVPRELHRASHSLKSTAATFGAARLSQLCRDLEGASGHGLPKDADAMVAAIEAEWEVVRADLERLRP